MTILYQTRWLFSIRFTIAPAVWALNPFQPTGSRTPEYWLRMKTQSAAQLQNQQHSFGTLKRLRNTQEFLHLDQYSEDHLSEEFCKVSIHQIVGSRHATAVEIRAYLFFFLNFLFTMFFIYAAQNTYVPHIAYSHLELSIFYLFGVLIVKVICIISLILAPFLIKKRCDIIRYDPILGQNIFGNLRRN